MEQADEINKALRKLHERENFYEEAAKEFAEAEGDYRHAKAAAFLTADGTVAEREAKAAFAVWEQHRRKLTAEATLAIAKEKLLDVRSAISARQSILSAEAKVHYLSRDLTA